MKFPDTKKMFRDHCLIEKNMTAKNYRTIVRHMERLLEYLEIENLRKINETGIREYLAVASEKRAWSPKTYRTHLQSFRSYFKWCQNRGFVKMNPAKKIEKPKLPHRLPRYLTKSEVQIVFENATQYNWLYRFERIRNLAILHTFLYSGMRTNKHKGCECMPK